MQLFGKTREVLGETFRQAEAISERRIERAKTIDAQIGTSNSRAVGLCEEAHRSLQDVKRQVMQNLDVLEKNVMETLGKE